MSQLLTVQPHSVVLFGHDLLRLGDGASFRQAFGVAVRLREIKMHPKGTRTAMTWDDLGMVAYEDHPEGIMSHLHLAFDTIETPERPEQPISAVVEINGAHVDGETTEGKLPRLGATPIVATFGYQYFFQCDEYSLYFTFDRRRDARGRKTGTRRLAFVSFSWQPSTPPTL